MSGAYGAAAAGQRSVPAGAGLARRCAVPQRGHRRAFLSLGTLASCTVPTDVELANGTFELITVTYSKGAGENIESKVAGKSKGEIRTLLERGGFSITVREKVLRFESLWVPEEYVEMLFRSRRVKAQFVSDTCIYLVRPKDD